jgi:AmiR/NasT family two-component response regulator
VRAARHGLRERLDAGRAFHQAQGMLMARSGMSAAEAFEALLLASVNQDVSLFETAGRVVQEGS